VGERFFTKLTPTQRMCQQPVCMAAMERLYEVSVQTPDWLKAQKFAKHALGSHSIIGRRLGGGLDAAILELMNTSTPTSPMHSFLANLDLTALGVLRGDQHTAELSRAVNSLSNAAEVQLRQCMRDAGVDESDLGLPVSIAAMTGDGRFFDVQSMREQTCTTMAHWLLSRFSYYSGVEYAESRVHDGTNVGMVVAVVICSLNLVCCLGCCCGLLLCIRRRTCYFAAKEISPCCVECIVSMGCGPADAERFNNEAVMQTSEPMRDPMGEQPASAPKPTSDVELTERGV